MLKNAYSKPVRLKVRKKDVGKFEVVTEEVIADVETLKGTRTLRRYWDTHLTQILIKLIRNLLPMDPGDTMDDDMEVLENEMSEILGTISWSHNLPRGEATQGKEVEEKQKWEQHLKLGSLPQVVGRKSFMLLVLLFVLQQGSDTTWYLFRRN